MAGPDAGLPERDEAKLFTVAGLLIVVVAVALLIVPSVATAIARWGFVYGPDIAAATRGQCSVARLDSVADPATLFAAQTPCVVVLVDDSMPGADFQDESTVNYLGARAASAAVNAGYLPLCATAFAPGVAWDLPALSEGASWAMSVWRLERGSTAADYVCDEYPTGRPPG